MTRGREKRGSTGHRGQIRFALFLVFARVINKKMFTVDSQERADLLICCACTDF